ncbi:hypothetical protein P3T18_004221 [Paraburkholderia sp. GAS199]|uniref:DUF4148 domain-containing protein n=1 Tax=Paraburkholderia sp. GAS199 TaxID=3035126 RepID=UPI003D1A92F2
MKKILAGFALAAASLAAPALSFAQSSAPVSRAEVRADLVRLEQAGYRIGDGDSTTYPAAIQAAEAKVAAQGEQSASTSGYGGVAQPRTSSGAPMRTSMQPACVGPVSFCNIYAGS